MRRRWEPPLYGAVPILFLLLFFALPIAAVLVFAFGGGGRGLPAFFELVRDPAYAADSLRRAAQDLALHPYYRNRVLFTLEQATLSTLLTLAAGLPLAYLFSHHDFPLKRFLRAAFTAPFVLPALVVALAFYTFLGPRSILGLDLLTPLGPLGAILLAHVFYNVSLILRLVGNTWERLPPGLLESSRTLGAGPWRTLWRVELPLVRPAIVAASLLVFVFTLTTFGVVLLFRGDLPIGTIETLMFEVTRGIYPLYPLAATLALFQLVITYLALTAFVVLQRRHQTPLIPPTPRRRPPLPIWGWPIVGAAAVFLTGPPLALLIASFRPSGEWSLRGYELILTNEFPIGAYTGTAALTNSLAYAGGTLVLALVLAWLAALAAQRARHAAWAEALLLLPLGLSSVIVGLGFLLAWNGQGLPDLRASPSRILLAHVLIAFPFAARILSPTLEAIPPSLRETARTLGARPLAVTRLVDLPLSYPAIGVAAIYAFGTSLGEFGATLLLRRPETATVPLAIFDAFGRIGAPHHAQANAYAALLLVVAVLSFLLLERLRPRTGGEFA